jgi:hypothetical protein
MAYTLGITLLDVGGFYTAGIPSLTGILNVPPTAPATAVSSTPPFSISFASLPSPPAGPGTLYLGDPSGPGDFFRSGPISAWPPAPASINVLTIPTTPVAAVPGFTGVGRFSYSAITTLLFPTLPVAVNVPASVMLGIAAATAGAVIPASVSITGATFSASSAVVGAIHAQLTGVLSYVSLFLPTGIPIPSPIPIPLRAQYTATLDISLAPSGDAVTPANIIRVSASNLTIHSDISSLPAVVLEMLAPALSSALSGPLTDAINSTLSSGATAVLASGSVPGFGSTATVSVRSVSVLGSGVVILAIVGDFVRPTPPPPLRKLAASVLPAPAVTSALVTYTVTVTDAVSHAPVAGATVTLHNFSSTGTALTSTAPATDAAGHATFSAALRTKRSFITVIGTGDSGKPQREREPVEIAPTIVVHASGFSDLTQSLFAV